MAKDHDSEAARDDAPQGMPGWKKLTLVLAGLFVIAGLALRFGAPAGAQSEGGSGVDPRVLSQGAAADGGAGSLGSGTPGSSLLPGTFPGTGSGGGSADAQDGSGSAAADWSPFFLQGGFGFFLGFSVGLVLRTFFKVFAFGAGLLFLLLFGLQYLGVDIPWDSFRETYDSVAGRVSANADGLLAFMQGAVPATAFSGAGLVAGFKRS